MKLIKCYIENFGGLSHYRLDFQPGITIVQEENGFGKTTLAEFIRTMFYGFPRSGKTVDKNPRKKYTPWNGGSFGGYLVFEHNAKRYRIDRKFGATPKGDTFSLTDADTHKKSIDFTENIGIELFGLDAESFERSTYMPQVHDHTTVATTGIQSKLGDLVHDTNDINNYDKAIKALREKRSSYIPFRGKGGSVADAGSKITDLQTQMDQAEAKRPELAQLLEQLADLSETKAYKSGAREAIRREIQQRSQYDARKSAEKQLQSMTDRKLQLEAQHRLLLANYPKGLPAMAEVKRMEQVLSKLPALVPQPATQSDLDAQATVEQMGTRFESGVPDSTFFSDLRRLDKELIEAESTLKTAVLTDQEASQLQQLDGFFACGVPQNAAIDRCQNRIRERSAARDRLNSLFMPEADRLQLEHLKVFFANGLPEEADLDAQQQHLNRVHAYRQENLRISTAVEEKIHNAPAPEPAAGKKLLLPMIIGAVIACLGIGLIAMSYPVPGLIALVLGIVLSAVGFALKLKQDVASQLQASTPSAPVIGEEDRALMRSNAQQIDRLEQQVTTFTSKYISDGRPLQEKLSEIRANRKRYLDLEQRQAALSREADLLQNRLTELTAELTDFLNPYFGSAANYEDQLPQLQMRIAQFRDLSQKRDLYQDRSVKLRSTCHSLRTKLDAALASYGSATGANGYTAAIAQLEQDAHRYASATAHLAEQKRLRAALEQERQELSEELSRFSVKYAIGVDLSDPDSFHRLRSDVQKEPELHREVTQAAEDIQAFREEQADILALPVQDDLRDPEILKLTEAQLTGELQDLEQEIAATEQRRRMLCKTVDAIPQLQDEMEQWQRKRQCDIDNSGLLDQTIRFLEQAREALSLKYMGTVQQRFISYMNRISGEDHERIYVTPELEVTIERLGEPRPLDYFSAGQTDIVTLCMRLALVDALFEDTHPFVILDDPFVNLDDRNMKQALDILRELSEDHQILYLVCNSSRTL